MQDVPEGANIAHTGDVRLGEPRQPRVAWELKKLGLCLAEHLSSQIQKRASFVLCRQTFSGVSCCVMLCSFPPTTPFYTTYNTFGRTFIPIIY